MIETFITIMVIWYLNPSLKDLIKEIDKELCHLDYDIINNKKEDVANKN